MSIGIKVRLSCAPETPLPTVSRLELEEAVFQRLEDWTGNMELLLVHESGLELACQLSRTAMSASPDAMGEERALYLLLTEWPAGNENSELIFSFAKKPKPEAALIERSNNPWKHMPGVYLDHQEENARVVVSVQGALFTRYLYSLYVGKPYYYPMIGPNGKTLIQDAPDDHLHHHGLWWGHDDVNGHKVYHEFRGEGRQLHRKFLAMFGGPVFGQITSQVEWVGEQSQPLLTETRSVRIYNMPREARYVDLCTELHAVNGDVRFGDTKEGGFPFVRVNEQINGHHTGMLTAANGNRGEAGIFGTSTEWVDYSGTVYRDTDAGIAMFSHPENESYASQWFVRDYGPFTPANFHFCGGMDVPGGSTLRMKHRLYLHQGDVTSGKVKERYEEYIRQLPAELIL
ncbi:hypothetical protein DVH26_17735 [Paenibacillus sp. H1-7]|uniref:DUF6807 domain-containing protein n=1 Tax=Paenibacillus sp. H1-7 TaxID=2282849 RepID=UPI001EF820BA|nr:PmoA family protein [Paenibacillus sp. H1-7]ULL16130.1 hypothetical protein DVH26_17735 [Paenibacillus sp. H1-7]